MVPINKLNEKILYISVDGLLDPLGSSQILPYIKGSSRSDLVFLYVQ